LGWIYISMLLWATACSDDGDGSADAVAGGAGQEVPEGGGDGDATPDGGGAGLLVLDGEEITLGPGRCFLEEQEAAAGGGSIELTGQAAGTNAAGDPVTVDFTRYGEGSQFAGDDLSVTVGELGQHTSATGSLDAGAVSLEDDVLRGDGFSLMGDDGAQMSASFEIHC
jgi:hypothetical protein